MKLLGYMGTDQYGNTYHLKPKFPRKQLMEKLGYKFAEKIYVDNTDGNSKHCGYRIGDHWITLYRVYEF
tara:strand:- start:16560 stop:16766 length:207 start_codon:yes stop_codon:yes gene_type:complete